MRKPTTLAALAAAVTALSVAMLVTPAASGAATGTASGSHGAAPTTGAQYDSTGQSLIQGVVQRADQDDLFLDDVTVQAIDAQGQVAASALTYASQRPDGVQHGYFYLHVPPGAYTVTFDRDGYLSASIPASVDADGKTTVGSVLMRPVKSRVTVKRTGGDLAITRGAPVTVTFQITASPGKPTGVAVIYNDFKKKNGKTRTTALRRYAVTAGKPSTINYKVRNLAVGKHQIYLAFRGKSGTGNAQSTRLKVIAKTAK